MADDSAQERELPASQKRLEQAREKGQVPRSRDLSSSLLLLAAAAGLWVWGSSVYGAFAHLLLGGLAIPAEASRDTGAMMAFVGQMAVAGVGILLPMLAIGLVASLAGGLAMGGWIFSVQAFAPQFSRLNPVEGFGRIFSGKGAMELLKATLKALVVGAVAAWVLWSEKGELALLLQLAPQESIKSMAVLCGRAFMWLAAATLLIASVDVPWQLYQHFSRLRMSRQELQDESRESEGNPQIKQRIRALQRERARRRMMAAVPKADVVVTNPTHFAVALAYDQGSARAPIIVAMGSDRVAQRIREIAREASVPIVEAPPLARALYRYGELEQEIPAALYNAVALLLAYVYQLRLAPAAVELPQEWPIPSDLDTSADAMPQH